MKSKWIIASDTNSRTKHILTQQDRTKQEEGNWAGWVVDNVQCIATDNDWGVVWGITT